MAIKSFEEIVAIIKQGRPTWVDQAIKEHKRLNVHVNGKHTAAYLDAIDNIENADQLALRKKFLTTNRHIIANLARPIDKVFSAKGGGNLYNLNTDNKEKTLRTKLSNVRHGKAIRKWIKDIQANKYYSDPAGLVFFEWNKDKTYPTIKSIQSIINYQSDGRTIEWVLFEPTEIKEGEKDIKLYRFVDDAFDYTIIESDGQFSESKELTFKNPFKKVPAIINSDIINSDLTHTESPFELIISLADHYLRTGTIKNLAEFLHGYPIFWRYLTDCPQCSGTGFIDGSACQKCNGTGKNLSKDISDIINVERPEAGEPVLTPDLAGYVTPDVVSWQEMRTEQESIKSLMELTLWGSKMVTDANNETATAAFLNVQPANERLNGFSDAFEDMEKKMTDLIGVFYLKTYEGSSISYGRRYLVESPDAIWNRYEKARKEGVSKVSLDYLLIQFYQSEYSNDIQNLAIAQKSIRLEPFIHKTDEELVALPVDDDSKKAKIYFNEWFKQLSIPDLLGKEINVLQNEYNTYLQTKNISDGNENV
jgi:hypothetical protein